MALRIAVPGRDRASRERSSQRARSFAVSGSLLRTLRAGRGWTQAEAAERAGLSERLLRKAEAGEPVEAQTIAILAQLYSSPASPLTPGSLLAKPAAKSSLRLHAEQTEAIVRRWYDELWNKGRLEVVDELAAPDAILHAQGDRLTRAQAREQLGRCGRRSPISTSWSISSPCRPTWWWRGGTCI